MDFQLSLEQRMLRDAAAAALAGAQGRWADALAKGGMLGVLLDEAHGGLGLGLVEASLVAAEAGRALAPYPVAETLAALPVLARVDPDGAGRVLAGDACLTAATCDLARSAGRLRGDIVVPFADRAGWVAASAAGGEVAILPRAELRDAVASDPIDPGAANGRLRVDLPAEGRIVGDPAFAPRLTLLRVAEMGGVARSCFDMAVQYLKDRTQFGRPIGANQALKHMAADSFVRVESIRVAVEYAAAAQDCALACPDDAEAQADAARSLDVLLAYAPRAARRIAEDAVQMHGGIGATWDFALNARLRRILRLGAAVGDGGAQRLALARAAAGAAERATFSAAAE